MAGTKVWTQKNGNMALAKPTDTGFKVTGRLRIEDPGTRSTWAHPVVHGGGIVPAVW